MLGKKFEKSNKEGHGLLWLNAFMSSKLPDCCKMPDSECEVNHPWVELEPVLYPSEDLSAIPLLWRHLPKVAMHDGQRLQSFPKSQHLLRIEDDKYRYFMVLMTRLNATSKLNHSMALHLIQSTKRKKDK